MTTRLHINRSHGHYIAQVRKEGHRLWQQVGGEFSSAEAALVEVSQNMAGMKRGRVLFIDHSGYYEPNLSMEVNRI